MRARTAGTSIRQLERLFTELIGETIGQHYARIRLDSARHLLRTTRLSVTDIGFACGFKSSSHFSRIYLARYGTSPSRDREQPNASARGAPPAHI